ncbi:tRNA (adenosine(37)-N6)-threonylcarbamoyltransferase complex ATPase subunit type 1 TsaE [Paenibacillus mucilaginosus]|uniref:tRNA threonylcarbamoyladenosine biosynthesis protein TsaE n=3 Tax=Paenibacillus mucilaginosus TaxID=61624 RepID=H6NQN2_9BACL|nr:tRNA (adenosine(37)-N6)-threonylcarbamoyltransferase complex ATPase subunit type 1 TsaE [Paenibacillus mucilaginosus]AEI45850.1 YdiB [Paenibacillus mucilaginosus KNP414]AFC33500.1 YdiB [Paenibacillus mucilaginosus 3016]AFH65820.1 ATP/GTP hydrolase [Paenibacillus mucilaginosus K02]MCG7217811.1 tRNA (adenosine(37)-N6)-threonylcarbamoyltransferase complex ATPase subunit type 1 TsaE [Paenibacillus mucilaginosus]WDM27217.1 tRNA (adenosine(37)-N6)-threonylcarbamoyltransferase complex ATPase subun
MSSYQYRSRNVEETAFLAQQLAGLFGPGTVITLDGDLGAGKTTFSQAVGRALGVKETVNSPTFTIIKEYRGETLPFYHMDVYRLSAEEADELGLDEYFYGSGVTLVEWGSLIEELLPESRLEIRIEHAGEQERIFRLQPHGEPYRKWCGKLKENGL